MRIVDPGYKVLYPRSYEGFVEEAKDIERMGRIAYKSEDKIADTSYEGFIETLIAKGHESVLEHSVMKVIFTCDRGVSHELVRHRLCAFTQESTRYCNYSRHKFGNEITVIKPDFSTESEAYSWDDSIQRAEYRYLCLIEAGVSPQIARSVLPNSLKTEIGVSANFREWRHIFKMRALNKNAHPQMQALVGPLYECVRAMLPCVFEMGDRP